MIAGYERNWTEKTRWIRNQFHYLYLFSEDLSLESRPDSGVNGTEQPEAEHLGLLERPVDCSEMELAAMVKRQGAAGGQGGHAKGKNRPVSASISANETPRNLPTSTAIVSCFAMAGFALAVALGCAAYETDTPVMPGVARSSLNPLLTYDRLLRVAGPIFPLAPPLVRSWLATSSPGRVSILPSLKVTLAIYAAAAALRLMLYLSLLPGSPLGPLEPETGSLHQHLMSDHIFLGGCMAASLATEASLLIAYLSCYPSHLRAWAALLFASLLWLVTAGDMHYTARYFHPVSENLRALGASLVLFHAPQATWAIWHGIQCTSKPSNVD